MINSLKGIGILPLNLTFFSALCSVLGEQLQFHDPVFAVKDDYVGFGADNWDRT